MALLAIAGTLLQPHLAGAISSDSWNMAAGNSAYDQPGQEEAALNIAIQHGYFGRPMTMALQEICTSRAQDLAAYLAALNVYVSPLIHPVYPTENCDGSTTRANEIFAAGPLIALSEYFVSPQGPDSQQRWLDCTERQNIGFQYRACSTHLSHMRPNPAVYQANRAWELATGPPGPFPPGDMYNIVGGDFNQIPGEGQPAIFNPAPTYKWYYTHAEAHNLASCATHYNQGKIDYIFARRDRSATSPGTGGCGQMEWHPEVSDHKYFWGFFTLS